MADQRTLFTRIVEGELPGRFVWLDEVAVVFLTTAPVTDGHALVVPRAEVDAFTDAPDDLLAHLVVVAKAVGRAQRAAWSAPRAALVVAGFEVPHLHLHVLPAWGEAELSFANARSDVPAVELATAGDRLRGALRELGHTARVPA